MPERSVIKLPLQSNTLNNGKLYNGVKSLILLSSKDNSSNFVLNFK